MSNKSTERKTGWNTEYEMDAISYMASDQKRRGDEKRPTLKERKYKLAAWLNTVDNRTWGQPIDVDACRAHAINLYAEMN